MTSNRVDLEYQVQKVLQVEHGGAGNTKGLPPGVGIVATNGSGSSIAVGAIVSWISTANIREANTIEACTADADPLAFGVCLGRVDADGNVSYQSVPDQYDALVARMGEVPVLLRDNVTQGDYCYGTTTAGQARAGKAVGSGAIGRFKTSGTASGTATVELFPVFDYQFYIFDVKAYGATANGTTDDTTAINAAIAAYNAAGGGILYFPHGYYRVTSALTTITARGLILGDGRASTDGTTDAVSKINFESTTATCFTITSNNVSFSRLALFNSSGGTVTAGAGIAVTSGGSWAIYDSLSVYGFYINVDIREGASWSMRDCHLHHHWLYGLKIQYISVPDGGDQFINNCYIVDGAHSSTAAIRIESGGGMKITNCKINSNSSGVNHGIDLAIASGIGTADLLISNTSIEGFRGNGINVSTQAGTGSWVEIEIVGVQISPDPSNTTGHAIAMAATNINQVQAVAIVGCNFWTNAVSPTGSAIDLTKIENVAISACVRHGFPSLLTQASCTNVHDYSGGIAGEVAVTGTPSSGDVPVASSGTAASWQAPTIAGVSVTDTGGAGAVLYKTGAAAATWALPGGDLSGSWPSPTVAKINGSTLGTLTSAANGDRLRFDGSAWSLTTRVWMPLTTVVAGAPELVWDADDSLIPTEVTT